MQKHNMQPTLKNGGQNVAGKITKKSGENICLIKKQLLPMTISFHCHY